MSMSLVQYLRRRPGAELQSSCLFDALSLDVAASKKSGHINLKPSQALQKLRPRQETMRPQDWRSPAELGSAAARHEVQSGVAIDEAPASKILFDALSLESGQRRWQASRRNRRATEKAACKQRLAASTLNARTSHVELNGDRAFDALWGWRDPVHIAWPGSDWRTELGSSESRSCSTTVTAEPPSSPSGRTSEADELESELGRFSV